MQEKCKKSLWLVKEFSKWKLHYSYIALIIIPGAYNTTRNLFLICLFYKQIKPNSNQLTGEKHRAEFLKQMSDLSSFIPKSLKCFIMSV